MRIALINSSPSKTTYSIACLKIGAWLKSRGDYCELFEDVLPPAGDFDEIWISTVFTFDAHHVITLIREAKKRCNRVQVGGISATLLPDIYRAEGVDVVVGYQHEAEGFIPDYSLLKKPTPYSILYTSRGCIRRCAFCMVPILDPVFYDIPDWEKYISPDSNSLIFYDNNFTAKPMDSFRRDVAKLHKLCDSGKIKSIDFNQGFDCRIITEEQADLLKGLPINPVRFAFDGMHEDGHYQRAIRLMASRGFRNFTSYTLYNFNDTPMDFWYRLHESVKLGIELNIQCAGYPMRFIPILELSKQRDYVGKNWTDLKRKNFMTLYTHAYAGAAVVSASSEAEFSYWFGKTAEELDRLLGYPNLRKLLDRKKGHLRNIRKDLVD
jgi:hypothetical protein